MDFGKFMNLSVNFKETTSKFCEVLYYCYITVTVRADRKWSGLLSQLAPVAWFPDLAVQL